MPVPLVPDGLSARFGKVSVRLTIGVVLFLVAPRQAGAHVSEQGFVLLLPTNLYVAGGVASVAVTVLILMLLPPGAAAAIFRSARLGPPAPLGAAMVTSCLSALFLLALLWIGWTGPSDPLKNLLPLTVWVLWWVLLVATQGLFGNIWGYLNPMTGPAKLAAKVTGWRPPLQLPASFGHAPAIALFLAFGCFVLADAAPADPPRLATVVAAYWSLNFVAVALFGPRWLIRGEMVTVFLRQYGRLGLLGRRKQVRAGLWGWQLLARRHVPFGVAILMLSLLATGSFDGLNETFWWLDLIGINPLDFPGRSAIMQETILGLLGANVLLITAYAMAIWLGHRLAGGTGATRGDFCRYAPSILPIALGYHIGHYLPTFLVDSQYTLAAYSDPLGRGDDLLKLGTFYVTTGFFNTQATVRAIWLTQAGAVVVGHVLAILLAHAIAVRLYGESRKAVLSQAPLAVFMVFYTFFGLWLLASPRGA